MDTSAILGFKQPDQMQNLSSLVNMARGAQDLQRSQQQTESEGIALQEKKHIQSVLSDPASYTNEDGTVDFRRAMPLIMRGAPTSGMQWVQKLAEAQDSHTKALQSLNALTTDTRATLGGVLAGIPPGSPPDLIEKTIDSFGDLYKGSAPLLSSIKKGYEAAKQGGQKAVDDYLGRVARSVLPQETQRALNTPTVATVDNGQQIEGVNLAPGVAGMPQGGKVFSVQKQLPPTTGTVGPNNQPGYVGPQPAAQPGAQPGVTGNFKGNPEEVQAAIAGMKDPQERANAQAAFEEQARRTPGFGSGGGFVPSGPVPGANESKMGSVQVANEHWSRVNAGAADSPTATALLGSIRDLAPNAITGTEAGKKAYWNGLFNALGMQTKPSGDLQRDTDLLNKAMAQLNLSTPATTDAMRTLVEAGRPHSTMSAGAIKDAAHQIEGQLKANMAMRDMLTADKRFADATGDVSAYDAKRQQLEKMLDPRIFQYESLPAAERKAFMAKINAEDRAKLVEKARKLEAMGMFK